MYIFVLFQDVDFTNSLVAGIGGVSLKPECAGWFIVSL